MMTQNPDKKREQIVMLCMDDMVPQDHLLRKIDTNRDGYWEYKSCGKTCAACPLLSRCTESRDHVKLVTRHVWADYVEKCEDVRHTIGMKELYGQRKETIERLFGTAKEAHGFRYTNMNGKARMNMKVGLTFACMNLKKLANMMHKMRLSGGLDKPFSATFMIKAAFA